MIPILMCKTRKIKNLAMSRIGCGLDQLNWDIVRDIIIKNFKQSGCIILSMNAHPPLPHEKNEHLKLHTNQHIHLPVLTYLPFMIQATGN